ncbi:GNAT family N-acetyltransferase [Carbonactinospora thermoautotrophica]|uniref:GNAT family N-acetyltransferase n=1 Tax=Carbonactinospora thermoautotrophica TaxID=1469144 RepID=UPI0022705FE1|nr:GNAT family N-acetyltransferase [Carbonactinospora thermoautotrophica]
MTTAHGGELLTARPYRSGDEAAVLELINHDRVPGQPRCTGGMLTEALAGRAAVDAGWWTRQPSTDVLVDETGRPVGVVSYVITRYDDTGLLLWLHGRERPHVVRALVDRAFDRFGRRSRLAAFTVRSPLVLGLEGLPVRHRAATHHALIRSGFTGQDLWRYMRRGLTDISPAAYPVATITPSPDIPGWRLRIRDHNGTTAAEAAVGAPIDGIAVLWWIAVHPADSSDTLGRTLLDQALAHLADQGAREVILFVDDNAPGGDRDRAVANRLYDTAGFVEVDRLYSYMRTF